MHAVGSLSLRPRLPAMPAMLDCMRGTKDTGHGSIGVTLVDAKTALVDTANDVQDPTQREKGKMCFHDLNDHGKGK